RRAGSATRRTPSVVVGRNTAEEGSSLNMMLRVRSCFLAERRDGDPSQILKLLGYSPQCVSLIEERVECRAFWPRFGPNVPVTKNCLERLRRTSSDELSVEEMAIDVAKPFRHKLRDRVEPNFGKMPFNR